MVPEQESCHYNLSLVLFIPFWLLLISLVGSSFSASSWKTGAPQGSVLGPLFWFYSPPLPGDLIWSSTTFFNYHPHWIEAQVQLFSPGLFSDIRPLFRLPPGHFHCLCPCCVFFVCFFPLSSTRTIISLMLFQGSAFSKSNLHPVFHTGQEAVWFSLSS